MSHPRKKKRVIQQLAHVCTSHFYETNMGPIWDAGKGTDVLYDHPLLPGTAPRGQYGSQYPTVRAVQGWKRPARSSGPEVHQRLEADPVLACVLFKGDRHSLPPSQGWKVP